jgi:hypothetical protein
MSFPDEGFTLRFPNEGFTMRFPDEGFTKLDNYDVFIVVLYFCRM